LLGQLDEADEEQVELRLLSDPAFCEEFDVVVDEISIRYVAGGFEGDEKDRVERYFLRAPERQNKVKVMCELMHQSAVTRGEQPAPSPKPVPVGDDGLFARLRRFWIAEPLMFRFAATMALILIVAGIVFLGRSGRQASVSYATLVLASSNAERGQEPAANQVQSIKLEQGIGELRIQLLLPSQSTPAKGYRAEFLPPYAGKTLTVKSQDSRSVTVAVPAVELTPDRYAIRLFAIYADGREEKVSGSYIFRVE